MKGDSVPVAARELRDEWNSKMRNRRGGWYRQNCSPRITERMGGTQWLREIDTEQGVINDTYRRLRPYTRFYGQFKGLQELWREWQKVKEVDPTFKPIQKLEEENSTAWKLVREMERSGLKRGEALDWLFGELPLRTNNLLPDVLTGILKRWCAAQIGYPGRRRWTRESWASTLEVLCMKGEEGLLASSLYRKVYAW